MTKNWTPKQTLRDLLDLPPEERVLRIKAWQKDLHQKVKQYISLMTGLPISRIRLNVNWKIGQQTWISWETDEE